MKPVFTLFGLLLLAACGNTGASVAPGAVTGSVTLNVPAPAPSSRASKFKAYACQVDNVVHPIADGALQTIGVANSLGSLAAALNDDVIHPLIVAYCAGQNGTGVVLTGAVSATPVPAAAPKS